MPIPKKFRMPDIPKYNRTTDPNEYITSYTCGIKGNDLNDDETESVLLRRFGETLSKRAMIWYHNLAPNSINSFAMLEDAFVKSHAGAIKVATRKSNVFKIKQRDDGMLREFVSRFQMERKELPPVSDVWAVQTFMQAVTWSDVDNWYQSKIRVEDDQLGAPLGSVHPNRFAAKPPRDTDRGSRFNKERYQPYIEDRRNILRRNAPRNDRRVDRGQSSWGFMGKSGSDRRSGPAEAPKLLEYNFNADASSIILEIGKIEDTRWPKPI
uniref:Retrotransposon gag domain-containing protein n=1 Tax=Nicotiana tabacum TaxID=4097 RepID=A0A1S4A797_TOBAC|nr:PREDICTED: uncharacterized protein LOC107794523 [Nicotiana tabacum]